MLQRLTAHIVECLVHADDCERRAQTMTDAQIKVDLLDMARKWRRLAESYQFVERVDGYLQETARIGSLARRPNAT